MKQKLPGLQYDNGGSRLFALSKLWPRRKKILAAVCN